MADSFAQFARKLEKVEDDATGRRALSAIGGGAKDDAAAAVRGDLGDLSMSHWRRGNPIQITARYDIQSDSSVDVTPERKNRGPWRVLEDGRQHGSSADLVLVGRARKNGTRRARSRGRNQGATGGKSTWSDAVELMEKNTPKRVHDQLVKALRRQF